MTNQQAIMGMMETIAMRFQPEKIILFGSYASGRPDPGSGIDLLVVMPVVEGSKRKMAEAIDKALSDR